MRILELLAVAAGMSMDAFTAAACVGLAVAKPVFRKSLAVGLYFGIFHAAMPLTGYLLAARFTGRMAAFGPWAAFALFSYIGGKMIFESLRKSVRPAPVELSLRPTKMLPLAFATSVDALAAGVSLALLRVNIAAAVLPIGCIAMAASMAGVKIGSLFGTRFHSRARLAGGAVLLLMGLKILLGARN